METTCDFQMSISLKAREAYNPDVGLGVVRVDYDLMDPVESGAPDPVEIIANNGKSTFANRLPLYPSDEGKGIARFDDIPRTNIGVKVGDTIEIRKVGYYKAEIVTVVRLQPIQPIDGFQLADALESVPVKVGDVVRLPFFGRDPQFRVVDILPTPTKGKEAAIPISRTKWVIDNPR